MTGLKDFENVCNLSSVLRSHSSCGFHPGFQPTSICSRFLFCVGVSAGEVRDEPADCVSACSGAAAAGLGALLQIQTDTLG